MTIRAAAAAAFLASAVGCGETEFEPPDREARVAAADSAWAEVRFDTVSFSGDSLRAVEGSAVFAARCRNCHGPLGRGGTEYAAQRELEVPSLVEPEWRYAGDLDAVRRRIFTGHPRGMPTWGVAGLELREIDAVAFYLLERLRPEVLDGR